MSRNKVSASLQGSYIPYQPALRVAGTLAIMESEVLQKQKAMTLEYPIKHWLATLGLGSVILVIYDSLFIHNNTMLSGLEFCLMLLLFGLLFSLPMLLIYYFSFKMISRELKSKSKVKITLLLIAIAGTLSTFYLIGGNLMYPSMISYSIALVMTAIFLKINNESEEVSA